MSQMSNQAEFDPTAERLRTALRETAEVVRPETLRPLRVPLPRAGRGHRWLAPLTAAAGVVALVAAAVLVGTGGREATGPAQVSGAGGRAPSSTAAPFAPPAIPEGGRGKAAAPRFLVAVGGRDRLLTVLDSRTGGRVALAPPPNGLEFTLVAAAAKVRTFVVAARAPASRRVLFHRLRLSERGRIVELSRIPRATLDTADTSGRFDDMAVSPDGGLIAYATHAAGPAREPVEGAAAVVARLELIPVGGGKHRTWTTSRLGRIGSLSWSDAGPMFVWHLVDRAPRSLGVVSVRDEIRTLDAAGAASGADGSAGSGADGGAGGGAGGGLGASTLLFSRPNGIQAAVSMPRGRVLTVMGKRLALYSATGRLIRESAGEIAGRSVSHLVRAGSAGSGAPVLAIAAGPRAPGYGWVDPGSLTLTPASTTALPDAAADIAW
jgi:hypothetical protein